MKEWDAWLDNGVSEVDKSYLKDRNRGMILLFLDKIRATGDAKYIHYLEQWKKIDYKKVRQAIRETIDVLRQHSDGKVETDTHRKAADQSAARETTAGDELQIPELEPYRLKCWECGNRFVFEVEEQKFFKMKGFDPPKRCPRCREKKWLRNMGIEVW